MSLPGRVPMYGRSGYCCSFSFFCESVLCSSPPLYSRSPLLRRFGKWGGRPWRKCSGRRGGGACTARILAGFLVGRKIEFLLPCLPGNQHTNLFLLINFSSMLGIYPRERSTIHPRVCLSYALGVALTDPGGDGFAGGGSGSNENQERGMRREGGRRRERQQHMGGTNWPLGLIRGGGGGKGGGRERGPRVDDHQSSRTTATKKVSLLGRLPRHHLCPLPFVVTSSGLISHVFAPLWLPFILPSFPQPWESHFPQLVKNSFGE